VTAITVTIDARFRGPPHSGHGGYSSGLVADAVGNPAEVTLRRPPPLERPLALRREGSDGRVVLVDDAALIAEGRRAEPFEVALVSPVSWDEAETARVAAAATVGDEHPIPSCFGCSTARAPGDGLRLLPGRVAGRGDEVCAVPWVPDRSLAGPTGGLSPGHVWSALDCPTGWAAIWEAFNPWVLGRFAVDIRGPVELGGRYVITSWLVERDGRKARTEGALRTEDGDVRAVARATWIEVTAESLEPGTEEGT
jgi:hypothetical protein